LSSHSLPASSVLDEIASKPVWLPRERRLKMLALASLIYFTSSGGAFGLEPLIGAIGPLWGGVLILVAPLVWSLPISLIAAELTGLMPEEGGFYIWVRETMGAFWGVQEAWWVLTYAVIVLAIFPVLFVTYLTFFFPALAASADGVHPVLGALLRWLVAILVIASSMVVNLKGAREAGRLAKLGAVFVLGAFAIMILVWLRRGDGPGGVAGVVAHGFGNEHHGALLLVLSIVVFNFSGWDCASTYAAEVDEPQRNYPKAIALALGITVLSYLLPVIAGVSVTTDPKIWSDAAGWPVIAQLIGGHWLGNLLAAAGLASMWGLFNAQLLYASRLPYVMAYDRWLPKALAKASPGIGAPTLAIISLCVIAGIFAALSFGELAVIQCVVYAGVPILECIALVILRLRRPDAPRLFRVPGGWWGLGYVCLAPLGFAMLVLFSALREWRGFRGQLFVVALIVVSGVCLYWVRRRIALPRVGGGEQAELLEAE
jgi:amino acid transporter